MRRTRNQLILMYYFMLDRQQAPGEKRWRLATAVLIGAAIYYSWHVWQLLRKMAEGYQAGDSTVKGITLRDTNCFQRLQRRFVVARRHFTAVCACSFFPYFFPTKDSLSIVMMKVCAVLVVFHVCTFQATIVDAVVFQAESKMNVIQLSPCANSLPLS